VTRHITRYASGSNGPPVLVTALKWSQWPGCSGSKDETGLKPLSAVLVSVQISTSGNCNVLPGNWPFRCLHVRLFVQFGRYDEPSNDLGPSSLHQSCPDCIIATRGYEFREGQRSLRAMSGSKKLSRHSRALARRSRVSEARCSRFRATFDQFLAPVSGRQFSISALGCRRLGSKLVETGSTRLNVS
jgi:hypothetical protein